MTIFMSEVSSLLQTSLTFEELGDKSTKIQFCRAYQLLISFTSVLDLFCAKIQRSRSDLLIHCNLLGLGGRRRRVGGDGGICGHGRHDDHAVQTLLRQKALNS